MDLNLLRERVNGYKLLPRYARIKKAYQERHPKTVYDLVIADLRKRGKNVKQITYELYLLTCGNDSDESKSKEAIIHDELIDESTVYRALRRVKNFEEEHERERIREQFYKDSAVVHREMLWARKNLNTSAYKLYYNLIRSYHYGREYSGKHDVHRVIPGLVNRSQREKALRQLNSLEVKLESRTKKVKIFDYVRYDEKGYQFQLSHNALPYYDPYYYILDLMGPHDWEE